MIHNFYLVYRRFCCIPSFITVSLSELYDYFFDHFSEIPDLSVFHGFCTKFDFSTEKLTLSQFDIKKDGVIFRTSNNPAPWGEK